MKTGVLQNQNFARQRNAEKGKNNVSLASEERKTQKIGFRLQAKCKKWEKQRFACKRRIKNAENRLSLASEMQKMGKTAFRLQATSKKR